MRCGILKKRLTSWFLLIGLMLTIFGQNTLTSEAAKVSNKNYEVSLYGPQLFLYNEKAGSSEIGTEYFLTYTVKDAVSNPTVKYSLAGTADPKRRQPYADGGAWRYNSQPIQLMEPGSTYFIRFVVAKGGFQYNITRADKNGDMENIYLDSVQGDATDKMTHFGLWIYGATLEASLTNVRCYDVNGNDLGVKISRGGAEELKQSLNLNRYYELTAKDASNISISHTRVPATNKMYIQYTVVSAEYKFTQEGVGLAHSVAAPYPHGADGYVRLNIYDEPTEQVELLEPGVTYLIEVQYTEENFDVLVQKTKGKKTGVFRLPIGYGPLFDKSAKFFYLWFGEDTSCKGSFQLTNVKFFDEKGNDLGVRCNQGMNPVQRGEIADYAGCVATYYCKETGDSMGLYEDYTLKQTLNQTVRNATYKITDSVLKAVFEDGTEEFDYLYNRITDSKGNVYERLYNYRINFVTGTKENIATQKFSNKEGYLAMKPADPVKEGYEFKGWYTSDDKEYNFDQIVTKSLTLYAKYDKVAEQSSVVEQPQKNNGIVIGVVALAVVGGVAALLIIRRKRNGCN